MPSQTQSGTNTLTLNTDTDLGAGDLTTAGIYVLLVNAVNLANGETLIGYFKQKVLAADAGLTEEDRVCLAQHAQGTDLVQLGPYEIIHAGRFGLRQEGGTGRAFDWSVRRLDA